MSQGQVAYYFGTFDPIHDGHILLARTAYSQFKFSKIIFVLAYSPPHKATHCHSRDLNANFEARQHALQMALAPFPYCELNIIEATLPAPTYTIDTLRELMPDFDSHEQDIPFLMGADSFQSLASWKAADDLASRLWFIIAPRLGHSLDIRPLDCPMRVDLLHMPLIDISSTQLRMVR